MGRQCRWHQCYGSNGGASILYHFTGQQIDNRFLAADGSDPPDHRSEDRHSNVQNIYPQPIILVSAYWLGIENIPPVWPPFQAIFFHRQGMDKWELRFPWNHFWG